MRARQDRAKYAAKAADERRPSLLATCGGVFRFFVISTTQPELPPRANPVSPDIFQLGVWIRNTIKHFEWFESNGKIWFKTPIEPNHTYGLNMV